MRHDPYLLIHFIRETGLDFNQTSSSWVFECPKCNKKKLYFAKDTGHFICWVCADQGFRGSAEYGLAALTGKSVDEIRCRLTGNDLSGYIHIVSQDQKDEEVEIIEERYVWPAGFLPIDHKYCAAGRAYLESRGVPLAVAQKYELRWCPSRKSLVYPILEKGVLLGWQERFTKPRSWIDEFGNTFTQSKAVTAPGCNKSNLLMFSDNLIGSDHVVLCEGPMDAIHSDLCGGAVATLGKAVSRFQMELLVNWTKGNTKKRLYLGLDHDAAEVVTKIVYDYYPYFELYNMIPDGPDLGSRSFEEVKAMFDSATRISPGTIFYHLK